jgi:hypothetical protein
MHSHKPSKYFDPTQLFDSLPESVRNLVSEILTTEFDDARMPDMLVDDRDPESIECLSRDGFVASPTNCGGLLINRFTDLATFWGSGYTPRHLRVASEIEQQIAYSLDHARDATAEHFATLFTQHSMVPADANYPNLSDLAASNPTEFEPVLRWYEDAEMECMQDHDSSIMYQVRFMYHGHVSGIHSASVSAAVNCEGPYHREGRNEGAKEIEITWRTENGLRTKLTQALRKCIGEVF